VTVDVRRAGQRPVRDDRAAAESKRGEAGESGKHAVASGGVPAVECPVKEESPPIQSPGEAGGDGTAAQSNRGLSAVPVTVRPCSPYFRHGG
jgi:hypothetical protein